MARIANSVADIQKSKTTRGLPRPVDYGTADVASHTQGNDNFHRVFAIRPGEHVVMLTDPLLDPRVVQAVYGLARARGATFTSYMGPSTRPDGGAGRGARAWSSAPISWSRPGSPR